MKKVAIIYRTMNNPRVMDYLKKSFENIFMNYIIFENYCLTELEPDVIIDADAYILTRETMLYQLKNHITSYNNIVLMHRNLNRENLHRIPEIAKDTNVLIVNDSYESAVELICLLYESGTNHINLIPFDPSDTNNPLYRDCKICITANEIDLVPNYIENTINIGYREISFHTFIVLMNILNLNFDLTNRNLIHHISTIAEPNNSLYEDHLNNFIKSHVLEGLINDSNSALIITNEKYNLLFSSRKAQSLFNISDKSTSLFLSDLIDSDNFAVIEREVLLKTSMTFDKVQYFVEKEPFMLLDKIIGYSITFQSNKDLIDEKINSSRLLKEKGHYARYCFDDIVHDSHIMQECIKTAKTVALTDSTVLITGESGTGKELLAQSIHNYSNRKNKPFVALNCAALPESLLESELFGYEKGSFTGAQKDGKLGLFEQANSGTIFLDEIGDISYDLQVRLLRVLQEHEVIRIGSDRVIKIDTRIIAATNKDLSYEVKKGYFRKDLYYRLNVFTLSIDPLVNRKEDILTLMSHFLGEKYIQLTNSDKRLLCSYTWPGNVRELENIATYYKVLGKLPGYILDSLDSPTNINKILLDEINIEKEILKIIKENTQPYHGIGRVQLNRQLKSMNIHIGDSNLRDILHNLQEKGLITIGQGRSGTKITELGIDEVQLSSI